jgi:hypothetical protein
MGAAWELNLAECVAVFIKKFEKERGSRKGAKTLRTGERELREWTRMGDP